jgi:sulfate/thiosulfate transport system substrate-binding protein
MTRTTPLKWFGAAALSLTVLASTAACSDPASSGSDSGSKKSVSIVGFSILKNANKQVIADFQKTKAGKGVTFKESYGASGDQARAVISGLHADEVHLSLEPDMTKLTDENLVDQDWKSGPNKGIVTQSVVAIVTRPGNPKGIKGWDDLVKPGVKIVTPNPGSSGSAKWNILAAYGHVLANGGSEADAQAYLKKFLANVAAFPGSGKDATTAFEGGTGDVLLSYENEAIQARAAGADFDYFIPDQTLLIQNPGAVTKDASSSAKDFLDFQLSKEGQTDYTKQGFRPLDDSIKAEVKGANNPSDPFPNPPTLMTIDDDFGGWADANKKYFDDTNGIVTKLIAASGKS